MKLSTFGRFRYCLVVSFVLILCPFQQKALAAPVQQPTAKSISHFFMGLMFDWYGLIDIAVEEYKQAAKFDKNSFAIHLKLGADYARLGELDKAIDELKIAKDINPKRTQTYYILALIYSTQKQFDKATDEYESLLENFPQIDEAGKIEIDAYLGQLYYIQKKFYKALEKFKLISRLEPDNVEVKFLIGALYLDFKKRDKAEEYFRKVIDADPNHQNGLNSLGYMYAEDGANLDEAADLVKRAIEIEPDNGAFLDSLGWIYYKKGMNDDALKLLKEANALFQDAVILDHLGDVYHKIGQIANAREHWQQSLELAPDQEHIAEKLNALKKDEGVSE